MFPELANMLSWWQWLVLGAIPPAIVALYFLKLKRQALEVPSTYLWHKSIEDLHVNSIWQRLRKNLLLLLQLLLLLLLALALLRPNWHGRKLSGDRFIFLIDNSASMQATDVPGSRLEEAKGKTLELIAEMKSGDVAMVVSFSDGARVGQSFTDNRARLRDAVKAVEPTQRSTSLREALKVASGLANPGRSSADSTDTQVAEALPAELFIISDGCFDAVEGFSLGNLKPTFVAIGRPEAANVAITAFSVRHSEADMELLQAFARLENCGQQDVTVSVELFLDDRLIDRDRQKIPARDAVPVTFDLGLVESGVLRMKVEHDDHLSLDNEAWVVLKPPRRARVLLITSGNEPLQWVFETDSASEVGALRIEPPEFLEDKQYAAGAANGSYDLVIYDRCSPKEVPRANTLFVGSLPPDGKWSAGAEVGSLQIIDIAASHPLMQWIDLGDVIIAAGKPLQPPPGATVLIDSDVGPMAAIGPREAFEDIVLGFTIVDEHADEDGRVGKYFSTNLPFRIAFTVFALNLFDYLSGSDALGQSGFRPGSTVELDGATPRAKFRVRTPAGRKVGGETDKLGKLHFAETDELGVYGVNCGGKKFHPFAVNLFDTAESDIVFDLNRKGDPIVNIGYVELAGQAGWTPARREIWQLLLGLGLAVLLLEWYIYNRRVYM